MSTDAIIDFETLGQTDEAVLLSVGVVVIKEEYLDAEDLQGTFDRLIKEGLYIKIRVENQVTEYGRSIDKSTVDWWRTQGPEAQHVLKPSKDDVDLAEVGAMIEAFLKENGFNGHIWTRGMIDARWLESMCKTTDTEVPSAKWWLFRDVRTAIDVLCGTSRGYLPRELSYSPDGFVKHNALHDCANDSLQLLIAYSQ